jgi:ubiquinone/menaquinone biosynthesis C-methylase UbiE
MSVSCRFYRLCIDPLLSSLRKDIAALIPSGSSVLELGSGTGAQSLILSETCSRVVGIDINAAMTACAASRLQPGTHDHVAFHHGDGKNLSEINDKEFDTAAITLALHEMPQEYRAPVIQEMARCAHRVLIADYAAPLPKSPAGMFIRLIERFAGIAHYRGFRNYQQTGGLLPLLDECGLSVASSYTFLRKTIMVVICTE